MRKSLADLLQVAIERINIKAGTNVVANDLREINWVRRSELEGGCVADFQRRFYDDFAIRRGEELGCPDNFNLLTVGWYVNEPEQGQQPNLVPTSTYDLVAARDIRAGEELTVLYSAFES